mmetsp:Transcript_7498/g.11944  ORF Transcript_7498/g.11944 Transcript_7498/m.11944 type:complete len:273 (-) Transcript_7498:42-860(-)
MHAFIFSVLHVRTAHWQLNKRHTTSRSKPTIVCQAGTPADLQNSIARFYDRSSSLWEREYGEHMHHGFYGIDGKEKKDRIVAQIDMIDELLAWAQARGKVKSIVDVGCGIGGSSRYLARRWPEASVMGVTLSPFQAERARELTEAEGLSDRVHFQVADALDLPFQDASFDLVWSLESGEHMADKERFTREMGRMLQPGGLFICAQWCHRNMPPPLTDEETKLLQELYAAYSLPYIVAVDEPKAIAKSTGLFTAIETDDWSEAVRKLKRILFC